jgi:dolichol-phosphate mannosyltransferase
MRPGVYTRVLSVIVPAYNEASVIRVALERLMEVLDEFLTDYEVIVVNDGSEDKTAQVVESMSELFPKLRLETYERNQGKGHALRRGLAVSGGQMVVFFDGDLDIHPESIPTLIRHLERGGYDAVVASKLHPESRVKYPWLRRVFSRCFYAFVWLFLRLPVTDTQVGLKVFKGDVLRTIIHLPQVDGFAFDVELLALIHRAGFKIGEGPVWITYREFPSYVGPLAVIRALVDTVRVSYRLRMRKRP